MSTPVRNRIIDLDVTRAVALIGVVVMNYWGYLVLDGADKGTSFVSHVFDPWNGPLSTRFAAVFVMVAGMGVSLMTRRSRLSGDRVARSEDRWKLIRRGVMLYAFGYALNWIWSGTILFYYGAFFVAGAALFTLRKRWLVAVGAASAVAATLLQLWKYEREQASVTATFGSIHTTSKVHSTDWLFAPTGRSPRGLVFDTFVNGTHPLLPWLAFLCLGMVLGRLLPLRAEVRIMGAFAGIMVAVFSHLVHGAAATTPLLAVMLGNGPYSRSLVYTIGTVGSSVAAFCIIGSVADAMRHRRITIALAAAGRTTLTIYVLHALVFNLLVHVLGWIRPTGLDTAWLLSGAFWLLAITGAALWQERFGMGPLERIYRRFGGDAHPAEGSRPIDTTPAPAEPATFPAHPASDGHTATPISANVPAH